MPRILSMYIVRETLVPFLLTLFVLTSTALLGKIIQLTELFLSNDVSASGVLRLVAGSIPPLLYYTLPMAYLIGVLIGFARLSADSEFTAIKSGGVGVLSLLRPVLVTAFIGFVIMLYVAHYASPRSYALIYKTVFETGKVNAARAIEEQTFYDRFTGLTLYVDKVGSTPGDVEGVFISGDIPDVGEAVITAEKGRFQESVSGNFIRLMLENGIIRSSSDGNLHTVAFKQYETDLGLNLHFTVDYQKTNNKELDTGELLEKRDKSGVVGYITGVRQATYELHKRFAIPFSIFIFAIIGVSFGIQKVRSAKFSGFGAAVAVIICYFILQKGFESAVPSGALPAALCAWGPNVIMLSAAVYVTAKAVSEKTVINTAVIEDFFIAIGDKIASLIGKKA